MGCEKRIIYIDVIKGLTIVFMLWGHALQYCSKDAFDFYQHYLFKFIYSFHMPLFMLISGYLYYYTEKNKSFLLLMKTRIFSIFIPIVVWSAIHYLFEHIQFIFSGQFSGLSIISWISKFEGLWFLWSVLTCSIIIALVSKVIKGKMFLLFVLVAMPLVILFPMGEYNLYMYPFFAGAYLFNRYKEKLSLNLLKLRYLSIILYPILYSVFEKKHYFYTSGINPFSSDYGVMPQIGINMFRWLIGFIGCIFVMTIVELLMRVFAQCKIWISLSKIGSFSLQIYVMQGLFLEGIFFYLFFLKFIAYYGENLLAKNMLVYNFVWTPLIAGFFLAITYMLAVIIRKMPKSSRCLFGRY